MRVKVSRHMKGGVCILAMLSVVLGSEVHAVAVPVTAQQQAFAEQLKQGQYFYPVIDDQSEPLVGQPALFRDEAVAFATADGFWRSLLKGAAVVAGGVTNAAISTLVAPGSGTTVGGAEGVDSITNVLINTNLRGPGPGEQWLISDARFYESVQVGGVDDILPGILATAMANVESTVALSPTLSLSFVDPDVIGVAVTDFDGELVTTIDLAQAFVLTSTLGGTTEDFFGSVVLNTIGFPGSRPLTGGDFIKIDVGPLLTAPDGTFVALLSSPMVGFTAVGFTAVPTPGTLVLVGVGLLSLLGKNVHSRYKRQPPRGRWAFRRLRSPSSLNLHPATRDTCEFRYPMPPLAFARASFIRAQRYSSGILVLSVLFFAAVREDRRQTLSPILGRGRCLTLRAIVVLMFGLYLFAGPGRCFAGTLTASDKNFLRFSKPVRLT